VSRDAARDPCERSYPRFARSWPPID